MSVLKWSRVHKDCNTFGYRKMMRIPKNSEMKLFGRNPIRNDAELPFSGASVKMSRRTRYSQFSYRVESNNTVHKLLVVFATNSDSIHIIY